MPTFNFSGLTKKSGGSSYGFLVDQLEILENKLSSDGKLSPGDYKLLKEKAQEIYSHPGLSASDRSNVMVKISKYESDSSKSSLKDLSDIDRTNRAAKDDIAKATMLLSNNPSLFLQAKEEVVKQKLANLAQSIENIDSAQGDSTAHLNEYSNTLQEYNDILEAQEAVQSKNPNSGQVAFLTTNSAGEITDVKIGRIGSQSGYAETNGLYGGLKVYGKVNKKENGKNVFIIGKERFIGSDLYEQDPAVPGSLKPARLLSEKTTQGRTRGLVNSQDVEIDLTQVRPQSAIRIGGWAEGGKGFLYQRLEDGSYRKYSNLSKDKLGISDNDIIRIPDSIEQGILPAVGETIDGSKPFTAPLTTSTVPMSAQSAPQAPTEAPAPTGTSRTPSPTERSPRDVRGYAQRAFSRAGNWLKSIFR